MSDGRMWDELTITEQQEMQENIEDDARWHYLKDQEEKRMEKYYYPSITKKRVINKITPYYKHKAYLMILKKNKIDYLRGF